MYPYVLSCCLSLSLLFAYYIIYFESCQAFGKSSPLEALREATAAHQSHNTYLFLEVPSALFITLKMYSNSILGAENGGGDEGAGSSTSRDNTEIEGRAFPQAPTIQPPACSACTT